MNIKNDGNENILNCKNLKRNFESINELNNMESLNSMYMFDSNKRRHNIDLKDEMKNSGNVEIISGLNLKNKRKLEADFIDKKKKKVFTEIQKSFNFANDIFSKNNAYESANNIVLDEINDKSIKNSLRSNDDLLLENKIEQNKKHSMELAIIPFEGNSGASDYKYENKVTLKNSHLKNIFSLLSKKDIVYKNLKNHIKNNKPLMINCKDFNLLLNKYKYENEIDKKFNNQNSVDIHDNSELENNLLNSSIILHDNKIESINLNDINKIRDNNLCLNSNDILNTKLNELYLNSLTNKYDINCTLSNNNINNMNNANKGNKFDIISKTVNTDNIYSLNGNLEEIKNQNAINCMNNIYNFNNINISNNTIKANNYNLNDNNTFNNLSNDINFNKLNNDHNFMDFNNDNNVNVLYNENNFNNLNNDNNLNNLNNNINYYNFNKVDNLNSNYNIYNLSNLNSTDNLNNNDNMYNLNNIISLNKLHNLNNANIPNNINNFNNMNKLNNMNN
ncbi:conserved Plasmodium protein, unknown function [Plasmodium relictum]|uniref:Uncharacterized protein n=1 Tax=Plasmodium relictum TaxID=85471 RepID=A0A1J1HA08_PLARL|nr:conserved Plasmodium protein, unknown function [Plasmodium relictum]CRH01648.1 conserved Plasmodium protein, unknown function [Plasmodium relictum]